MNETENAGVVVHNIIPGNNSRTFACRVWSGVKVYANDIHCGYLGCSDDMKNLRSYIVINICIRGRCEVDLPDGYYVYMEPQTVCISDRTPKDGFFYPSELYNTFPICRTIQCRQTGLSSSEDDHACA